MSETLFLIAMVIMVLVIVILAAFSVTNSRLKNRHLRACADNELLIALHKEQIYLRHLRFNSYDFLVYNLKEVLLDQSVPDATSN